MCGGGDGAWELRLPAPLAPPSLSQIYVCIIPPPPNRSSISPGCKPDSPGNSRGAACHRAISTQGGGCGGSEQSAGKGEGGAGENEERGGRRELERMGVGWQDGRAERKETGRGGVRGSRRLFGGEHAAHRTWPQRAGPGAAHTDEGLRWAPSVQELLQSLAPGRPSGKRPTASLRGGAHLQGLPLRGIGIRGVEQDGGRRLLDPWREADYPPPWPLPPRVPPRPPGWGRTRGPTIPREINVALM